MLVFLGLSHADTLFKKNPIEFSICKPALAVKYFFMCLQQLRVGIFVTQNNIYRQLLPSLNSLIFFSRVIMYAVASLSVKFAFDQCWHFLTGQTFCLPSNTLVLQRLCPSYPPAFFQPLSFLLLYNCFQICPLKFLFPISGAGEGLRSLDLTQFVSALPA